VSTGTASGDIHANDALGTTTVVGVVSAVETENVPTGGSATVTGEYGTLEIDSDGSYTYTVDPNADVDAVQNDVFTITVSDGTTTDASTLTFTVNPDGTEPLAPEANISEGGTSVFGAPGAAEPGSTITVYGPDGTELGTAVAAADGSYEVTLSEPQNDGEALTVTATDGAGNESDATALEAPDTTAPSAPDAEISDDGATVFGGAGAAEPGSTITVYGPEETVLGTAVAADDGSYEVALSEPQSDGEELTVTATDGDGNESDATSLDAPDLVVAVNDTVTLELDVTTTPSNPPLQQVDMGGLLDLGLLGDTIEVSVLSGGNALEFEVAENATRQVSVDGEGGALLNLGLFGDVDFDLLVYHVAPGAEVATLVQRVDDWLEGSGGILGANWEADTLALGEFDQEGTYYVTLGNDGGLLDVDLLGSLELSSTSDLLTETNVEGTIAGNVISGTGGASADTVIAGTVVTDVDGSPVTGATVIAGDHGTLTINPDGSYSYTVDPLFAGADGTQEVFEYTITAPGGEEETATLTITLDFEGVAPGDDAALLQSVLDDLSLTASASSFDPDSGEPDVPEAPTFTGPFELANIQVSTDL
jgi:VCBS repeat-containing protein